jgi:hypothetical protein
MNSMINSSRLLAAALCAAILSGCNAVEDVAEVPSAALPEQTALLGGHIKDLGTRRPLILQYNGTDTCLIPVNPAEPAGRKVVAECRFFGAPDQEYSVFNFGALRVGTPYNITVKKQPFGKICTVQNPTGTVQVNNPEIQVNCADDPAVPHYTVTVNIAAAAASKPDLKVILTTENGTCPVNVNGRTSITFSSSECPDSDVTGYHRNATYIFNSLTNLPVFAWSVTATVPGPTAVSPRQNCFVSNTTSPPLVANTGGNIGDNGVAAAGTAPTGNITAGTINVVSCGFTVRVQADYSRSPAESADPAIGSGDGVTVALRSQPYGVDVASAKITSFANAFIPFMIPDANGDPTATAYEAQSDPDAFYELVVKKSPTGMACTPGYSSTAGASTAAAGTSTSGPSPAHSTRSVGNQTDGGAVLLRRPASAYVANLWLVDRVIRCRRVATNPTPLRGVYWQHTVTTTTRTVGAGTPSVTVATAANRNLLTFFEDGQYLFANHTGSQTTSEGVEQGFYAYNPGAAISGQPATSIHFAAMTDINGASGLHACTAPACSTAGIARVITNVVKSAGPPKTIAARVSNTTASGITMVANGGTLTLTINNGQTFDVNQGGANVTYTTANFSALVAAINAVQGAAGIATISGSEIRLTGPAGGVVFGGSAVGTLGIPATLAAGATATSTNVATTLATTVNTIVDWKLTEVGPDTRVTTTNALDGGWVTWDWQRQPAPVEDRRRVFVYQHGAYNAFHIGVNGIPNMQATCFVGDFGLSGTWTRHGSGQGCNMNIPTDTVTDGSAPVRTLNPTTGSLASGDIPSPTTSNSVLRDIPGRWPQSQNPLFTDGRPYSPVDYEVRLAGAAPGDPVCPNSDKLTVWDTINGVRRETLIPPIPRLVLCRVTAN